MVNRASLKADMSSILPKNGRFIYSVLFPQIIDINECIRNPCHGSVTCNNAKDTWYICGYDSGYSSDCFNCTGIQTFNFYSRYRRYTYKLVKKKAQKRFVICSILFPQIVDIDECIRNPCHANASCNNTEGSYMSACHSGYSGDGFNCTVMHCMLLILILLQ